MVTDKIADLLTRIRNAQRVGHPTVVVPASKQKEAVLTVLFSEGYVGSFSKEGRDTFIKLESIDKQLIGQVAAQIRALRPPEPYKGKGVRYRNEQIRLKAGKAGESNVVLGAASTKGLDTSTGSVPSAKELGKAIAKVAADKKISAVVFDRNGYVYHGRVAAVAEGAREAGLSF
ncbi:UNVERIFIED_CONTAM: hypothetical protein GTU68_003119 [Idotea baltica]|nr:hypothetical protein [Idotea baltica]